MNLSTDDEPVARNPRCVEIDAYTIEAAIEITPSQPFRLRPKAL
jgi:hypothetical protein